MSDDIRERMEAFSSELKEGKMRSFHITKTTVLLLRRIISNTRWGNAGELLERIRTEGRKLVSAHTDETTIANMFRRVMKFIRDEYSRAVKAMKKPDGKGVDSTAERHAYLSDTNPDDLTESVPSLKSSVIELINEELLPEIDGSADYIAAQAPEQIHSDEVILTFGHSRTVAAFLQRAARKRKFQVLIAESAPSFQGHEMAKALVADNIKTVLISDAAVFAMMSRVNQVIIGTHTIMADGGLKAPIGALGICLAAKHHSVPVSVCAAMFKLSPHFPCSYDHDTFNLVKSPHPILPFSAAHGMSRVKILNPVFDYVPPDLITLFLSNLGGNAPSYVYRLLSELYHPDDQSLHDQ